MTSANEETKKALEAAIDRLKAWSNDQELDLNSDDVLTLLEHYDRAALSQSPQGEKCPLCGGDPKDCGAVKLEAPQPDTGADEEAYRLLNVLLNGYQGSSHVKNREWISIDMKRTDYHALEDFIEARKVDAQTCVKPGKVEYCYSADDETYHGTFDTIEQALAEAMDYPVYVAEVNYGHYSDFLPDALHIIEHAQNQACDGGPEVAESYLAGIPPEAIKAIDKELPTVIYDLFKRHGVSLDPTFYGVKNVVHYTEPPAPDSDDEVK